jgi:uncharacterized protein
MDRAVVLASLREQAPGLCRQFGLQRIAVFGSAARDELRADSDIDVLVDFIEPPAMARTSAPRTHWKPSSAGLLTW